MLCAAKNNVSLINKQNNPSRWDARCIKAMETNTNEQL